MQLSRLLIVAFAGMALAAPAAPVAPCMKRSPASAHTVRAAAHSAEASV